MRKHIQKVVKHPLFSGTAIMIFGSNSVSFINYLYHFVMGRILGPAGYGELASMISLIGLLGMIPTALSLAIIKHISSSKSNEEVIGLTLWLKKRVFKASIFFSILIIISSPFISSFLNIHKISYIVIMAIYLFITIQSLLNRSIMQGLLKFKEIVLSNLAENLVKLLFGVFLVYIGFKVNGALVGFVLSGLAGWYITNLYLNKDKIKNSTNPNIKPLLLFALPVLIQSISTTSLYSSDVILVKHFFSPYDAGIYASLSTLGKIIFFATGPIATVMFPLVSKRKAGGQSHIKIFLSSFFVTAIFTLISLIIYGLFPDIIIKLLYGAAYLQAKNLVFWFGLFIGLFTLASLLINYNLSLGRVKITILPLLAAIFQIVLIILFHTSLYSVILISVLISALLLIMLLIYSIYESRYEF